MLAQITYDRATIEPMLAQIAYDLVNRSTHQTLVQHWLNIGPMYRTLTHCRVMYAIVLPAITCQNGATAQVHNRTDNFGSINHKHGYRNGISGMFMFWLPNTLG